MQICIIHISRTRTITIIPLTSKCNSILCNSRIIFGGKISHSNLGRATMPPLMAKNNYATRVPLVTMGCPTFTPKFDPFPFENLHPHLIHPSSTDPTHHPKRHADPVSHFSTILPPDRQTERQMG